MSDGTKQLVDSEKRMGRRPEGPAHPRKGGIVQTLKRTIAEFKEDELTDCGGRAHVLLGALDLPRAYRAGVDCRPRGRPEDRDQGLLTDVVSSVGPSSAVDTFKGPIESVTSSKGSAGIALIVGIAAALWTASGYVGAFMRASNVIYEVEEGRSFIKLRPLQMLVTLALILLMTLVLVALVLTGPVAEQVGSSLGIGSSAVTIWDIAKWPFLAVAVIFMFALLYYSAPNAKLPGFKWVTPGSILAIVVWLVASALFAFYVANFGSYNKTYGALAGVIIFLVWLWITNVAILLGAELNAEHERSRELKEGAPGAERELQLETAL